MQYYRFDVYGDKLQFGTPDRHKEIQDVTFLIATRWALEDLVKTQIGEIQSSSFAFEQGKPVTEIILERAKRHHATDEDRMFKRLLEDIQVDLGSIQMMTVVVELSRHGGVVQKFRIEAREAGVGRVRVIYYLPDQPEPLQNLKVDPIIAAIEAKF
ncbi:hypothetical protein [Rhizobium laguerreae]|uniref:hypothetical protein n=1 Tax=Rhizobium laguerreae TaxID=1076926 RepID=UPI001C910794|nr:hypothetical protein [Rhizobium laguerreae]MBY3231922.1 hypothetical protein [Rhizobium laguerreae]